MLMMISPTLRVSFSLPAIAQVSAVALDASLARIDRDEARLLRPGALRAEAHALYAALAADLLGRDLDVEARTLTAPDGTPLPHALARLGAARLPAATASIRRPWAADAKGLGDLAVDGAGGEAEGRERGRVSSIRPVTMRCSSLVGMA